MITIIFREAPPLLPSRIILINSVGAFIIGTFYETFITSETVVPEPERIYVTAEELFADNYQIIQENIKKSQNVKYEPLEVTYRRDFQKHNVNLTAKHFKIINTYLDLGPMDKVAGIYNNYYVPKRYLEALNSDLEWEWKFVSTMLDTKTSYWKFGAYRKEEYRGVIQSLNEAGITKHLHKLTDFKADLDYNSRIQRRKSMPNFDTNDPRPVSIYSKLTTIFYVWMTLLLLSTCVHLYEIYGFNFKDIPHLMQVC